jgi:hypothetical protein
MRAGSRFSTASPRGLLRIQTGLTAGGRGALVGFEHFGGAAPIMPFERGEPFSAEAGSGRATGGSRDPCFTLRRIG